MTTATTPSASEQRITRPVFHSAWIMAPEPKSIAFGELLIAIKRLNPGIVVGTWDSPNISAPPPPGSEPGVSMLMVDGIRLSIMSFAAPAPDHTFDIGRLPNIYMPDPVTVCGGHKAHYIVTGPDTPKSRHEALELARAVTLAARGIAAVANAMAVKWTDSDQIVPPSLIDEALANNWLALPGGVAPSLWVRLLVLGGRTTEGEQALIVGTVGLHAFMQRELEYAPTTRPLQIALGHAAAVAGYLLHPTVELQDNQTLGADGDTTYKIELRPRGVLLDSPIFYLNPVSNA